VLGAAARQAGVSPVIEGLPAGIEAVRRCGPNADYLFVMNHRHTPAVIGSGGVDLLSGATWSPTSTLAGGDVAVIRR